MLKIFLLNFALWVVPCLQTRPTNFDISNKNSPCLRFKIKVGGGHPIYTILSVSILKKMLDGFYMKIMDLTIQ